MRTNAQRGFAPRSVMTHVMSSWTLESLSPRACSGLSSTDARVAAVDGVGGCRIRGGGHRERALLRLGSAVGILAGACDDLAQLDVIRDVPFPGTFHRGRRDAHRRARARGGGGTWTPASDDRHVM